ncbi:MAG TPA: methyl-accepting chemotaxis protein [Accumulibacter sp.]|nr:methyl-accepting chemotaxis protein [Accumulibacter sp.]
MRNNQPVTQREFPYPSGKVIISHTDAKGRITHVNDALVEISGFSEEELLGKPHNILRHPDMPAEAFRDLWTTVQSGRPWTGVVKNRCKNGDHYWVRAYVTPIPDGSGYLSVRTEVPRTDVAAAEALYARMRDDSSIRLNEGQLLAAGPMGWLQRMNGRLRLTHRLWIAFLISMAFALFGTGIALWNQHQVSSRFADYISRDAVRLKAYGDMYAQGLQAGQAVRNIILDPANPKAHQNLNAASKAFTGALQRAQGLGSDGGDAESLKTIASQWDADAALKNRIVDLAKDGKQAEAIAMLNNEETPLWRKLKDELLRQSANVETQSAAAAAAVLNEAKEGRNASIAAFVLALVIGLGLVAAILIYVSHYLAQTRNSIRQIADGGDLRSPLPPARRDEIGDIMAQIATMRNKLHELVADIVDKIGLLNTETEGLATSAKVTHHVSGKQADAASGVATAIEQLSLSIDHVRDNASDSHRLSETARGRALEGGKIIQEASEEMMGISEAVSGAATAVRELASYSDQVSSVVRVIREIADQTNLLALNAAIEAARAGEAGRGFAVVADEVRKLAERTSSSTQEIAATIAKIQSGTGEAAHEMEASVAKVSTGVLLARRAGETMTDIRSAIEASEQAVGSITSALAEQSNAARDIAQRIEVILGGAESNAGSAGNTQQVATRLEELTTDLTRLASRFKIA